MSLQPPTHSSKATSDNNHQLPEADDDNDDKNWKDKILMKLNASDSDETSDEYTQDSFIVDITDKNGNLAKLYQKNAAQIEQQKRKIKKQAEIKHNTKQYKRDSQVIQNGGLFQIKVHIIECRGLKGEAKDIVTRVRIFNEKQSTKPISKANNPYWGMNHMLYFKFDLAPDELSRGKCLITVYNERKVLRDIQIGSYEFDLSMIYYKKYHEVYNQWVALVNTDKLVQTDDDTDSDTDETNKGIEGYMLVSIIILGPHDEQFIHKEVNDWSKVPSLRSGMILKPPGIVQKPYLLTVKVHRLRNLARTDEFSIAEKAIHSARGTENLDPMVYVEYAGLILRCKKVWEGFSPVIATQFLLPVMEPVFDKDIIITIMDYDFLERNDRVGCVRVDYHLLKSRINLVENKDKNIKLYHVKPRWYHMYGAPIGYTKGYARRMNKGLIEGSNYRGSVLLEFEVKKCDTKPVADILAIKDCDEIDNDFKKPPKEISPLISVISDNEPFSDDDEFDDNEAKKQIKIKKKHKCKHEPNELEYYIRADIYEGTEINDIRGVSFGTICVEIAVADCIGQSEWKEIPEKNAYIQWYQVLENMNMDEKLKVDRFKKQLSVPFGGRKDRHKLIGPFKIPSNWEQDDAIELPDVFIYICVTALGMTQPTEPISYCRVPLNEILPKKQTSMWGKPPRWYDMKQNLAVNRYGKDVFAGSLLIGLNAGTKTHEHVIRHKQMKSHKQIEQAHLAQYDSKSDESEIEESDIENIVLPKSNNANIMILIHEAVNLPKLDWDGNSDPFVKVTISINEPTEISKGGLGKENKIKKTNQKDLKDIEYRTDRTKVKKGTLNPNWGGEVFKFLNVDLTKEKYLDLEIWDWDWPEDNEFSCFVEGGIVLNKVLESKEENVDIENKWFTLKISEYAMKKYKKNKNKKNKKPAERSIQVSIYYDFLDEKEVNEIKETHEAEKQTKYSKNKKKKLGATIKNIFDTSNLFSNKNNAKREISDLQKNIVRKPMTLILHLFKAINLPNVDVTGLSDAFVKIRFCGVEKVSKVVNNHIDPQWNEILILHVDVPEVQNLNNAPRIYCEVLDHDIFKNRSMGRITVNVGKIRQDMEKNGHNMKQYEKNYAETYASWRALENSQKQRVEGELLMAFQLIEGKIEDSIDSIPAIVQPKKVKYNLQIISFGLRDIKCIFGVHKTFIEFEINGITYRTNKSNIPEKQNPNFNQILTFSVMLPDKRTFWPNLNVKIIDSLCGGAIKKTIGYSSIGISKYADSVQNDSQQDEQKYDKKDNINQIDSQKLVNKNNVVSGIDNSVSNDIKRKTIIKNNNEYHKIAQDSDDEHEQEHYSPFDYEVFNCYKDYEFGNSGAKYMDNRKIFETELENHLNLAPFHEESFFSGTDKEKSVARFKGHISLTKYNDKSSKKYSNKYFKDMRKQELFVRLYILYAQNLIPKDNVGMEYDVTNFGAKDRGNAASSDPYLKIKFGDTKISTRDRYISNTLNPEFYESFVFPATLPGPSKLLIQVWDYDGIGDDLCGQTIIDIEDRWYSADWREYGKRNRKDIPAEGRTLRVNESNEKLGKLFLWLELLPPEKHKRMAMTNIRPEAQTDHELRVIIYECRDVKDDDELTKGNDLYITGNLQCTTEEDEPNLQETDTHLRSHDGKGSFNWRMKFPIKLPKRRPSECPRLKLQIWDMDFFSGNDCISEAVIPLAGFLRYYDIHCQNNVTLRMVNNNDDNDDNDDPEKFKFWIDLDEENNLVDEEDVLLTKTWNSMKDTVTSLFKNRGKGKILISLEILPIKNAKRLSNGFGRDKPNRYPKLEEPKGRHKFTWNPFRLLKNIIGAYRCGQLTCICVWIGIFAFLLLITPNLISATFANIMIH